MKRNTLCLFAIIVGAAIGCQYEPIIPNDPPEVGEVSFIQDVEPVFTDAGCVSCHDGGTLFPDLSVGNAYGSLMSKTEVTDLSNNKNIYNYPHPSTGNHNNRYKNDEQAAIVKAWIDQGKQDN